MGWIWFDAERMSTDALLTRTSADMFQQSKQTNIVGHLAPNHWIINVDPSLDQLFDWIVRPCHQAEVKVLSKLIISLETCGRCVFLDLYPSTVAEKVPNKQKGTKPKSFAANIPKFVLSPKIQKYQLNKYGNEVSFQLPDATCSWQPSTSWKSILHYDWY